jgi:hypothetical protein
MRWIDGGLDQEFEQRLDELLAVVDPRWRAPEAQEPYRSDEQFRVYHRINSKRSHVGERLATRPDLAVALSDRVLDAIACDEDISASRHLMQPLLATIGRRRVQRRLISVIENDSPHKKVCAVRAWYWSQVSLVYDSAEAYDAGRPTRASRAADDEVSDLRGYYRIACLNAFVECDDAETRAWLSRGFLLEPAFYPPTMLGLVAQARVIAEADPLRYRDLLTKTDDGTNMAEIRPGG